MEFGVSLWARQGVHGFVMGEVGGVECERVGDGTVDAHAGALANNLRGVDQVFEGRLHTTRPGSAHDTGSDERQGNMRASWKCTRFPITCVGVSNTRMDVSIFPTGARAVPPSSRATVGP